MKKRMTIDQIVSNASMILAIDANFKQFENASIAIDRGKIVDIGSDIEIKKKFNSEHSIDVMRGIITPGLIDCHTHAVFSRTRENEYLDKLIGISYVDILLKGGGINASAAHLKTASIKELVDKGVFWLNEFLKYGVTCIEIKTGYGMDYESERKMLEAIHLIAKRVKQIVVPTFLAHIIPEQYKSLESKYLAIIKNKMLPDFKAYTDNFDIFIEKGAFSYAQADEIMREAKRLGYNIKIHANQINKLGAASLAKKYQAVSVDHLDNIDDSEIRLLADSGTIAVLLPGASYFMNSSYLPPVDIFRRYKVPIAVSTDFNPGTCPSPNLHMIMSMAVHRFHMGIQEVWQAVTKNAARALLLDKTIGSLEKGKLAHLVLWRMPNFVYPFYHFGMNFVEKVFID